VPHNINQYNKNMPRLDGTGPMGQGPRTGRGMGNCNGGIGYGFGRGYGCGCCDGYFGRMFYTKEERNKLLNDRKEALENELKAVNEELGQK